MNGIELISFQIISAVGTARSLYIEAIQHAKAGRFDEAELSMREGKENFTQGHHAHAKLIQDEAMEKTPDITLLLIHAEDQLMSAESFSIIASEFIDLYKKIKS